MNVRLRFDCGHNSGVLVLVRGEFEAFDGFRRPDLRPARPNLHSISCILRRTCRGRGRSGGYFCLRPAVWGRVYKTNWPRRGWVTRDYKTNSCRIRGSAGRAGSRRDSLGRPYRQVRHRRWERVWGSGSGRRLVPGGFRLSGGCGVRRGYSLLAANKATY